VAGLPNERDRGDPVAEIVPVVGIGPSPSISMHGHLMPGNEGEAAVLLDAYLDRADSQARITRVAA
jgi:hypothetical protein